MPELVFQKHVAPVLSPAGEVAEPNAGERTTVVLEPGEGTRSFRAALGELDEVDRLDVPSVTVRPLAPAHVTTTNQTAYVRDFEVEVREGAVIADPIVDVVQDGVSIQTSAVPLDGGRIGLSVEVEVADLQRPIPTFETTIGAGGAPVTIQLPQVLSRKVEAAVQLPARHTVVVVLPGMAGARYLVTFEVAEQAATGRDR
jgi:hypothetical protein